MPSARTHEVIALKINKEYHMDEILLRLGTVSPDSWRNVEEESGVKDKYLSHFWDFRIKDKQANDYTEFYLKYYNHLENPFYFGYLLHLITDQYWKSIIDPKYFYEENGIPKCRLKNGTTIEDKDWFSYYETLKIQKRLAKEYHLGLLPTKKEDIPNFECNIDELNLSGLFGPNGTVNYINTKLIPTQDDEESQIYDYNDVEKHIDETVSFIKQELNRLKLIKEEDEKKVKIAVDIDDTLLCTKELEDYYWCQFLKDNPDINPNQEYKWGNPILTKFWSEYREKMAFGKPKKGASNTLNELLSKGYRVDLLSARPLEKYASLKKKLVEYFDSVNIKYNYLNLGFYSKKEFLKEHHYDILIDNDMKYIEEALSVGVIPILYGNNPNYKGYQTESWEEDTNNNTRNNYKKKSKIIKHLLDI